MRGLANVASQTVTTDGDEFLLAVPGVEGHVYRTGHGTGLASVQAWDLGDAQIALLDMGFPGIGEAGVVGSGVVLTTMLTAPPGGVWDGNEVQIGRTFVYPTGSSHHATDPAGLAFVLTALPWETFATAATDLGYDPSSATKKVVDGGRMQSVLRRWLNQRDAPDQTLVIDSLLDAAVHAACEDDADFAGDERARDRLDADLVCGTDQILRASTSWRFPILTLCRHLHVSERRLQLAFRRSFGIGPLEYMHYRALQGAHRRLLFGTPANCRVATTAREHGFHHLGRFAELYRRTYGEQPSATLRRPAP